MDVGLLKKIWDQSTFLLSNYGSTILEFINIGVRTIDLFSNGGAHHWMSPWDRALPWSGCSSRRPPLGQSARLGYFSLFFSYSLRWVSFFETSNFLHIANHCWKSSADFVAQISVILNKASFCHVPCRR